MHSKKKILGGKSHKEKKTMVLIGKICERIGKKTPNPRLTGSKEDSLLLKSDGINFVTELMKLKDTLQTL